MKAWLKGGLVGFLIGLFIEIFLFFFANNFQILVRYIYYMSYPFAYLYTLIMQCGECFEAMYIIVVTPLIYGVIIGALIGWIYGKIKSSREVKK